MGFWAFSTAEPTAGPTAGRISAKRSERERKNRTRELELDHRRLEAEAARGRPGGAAVGRGRVLSEPAHIQNAHEVHRLHGPAWADRDQPTKDGNRRCDRARGHHYLSHDEQRDSVIRPGQSHPRPEREGRP